MTDLIARVLRRAVQQLPRGLSLPGSDHYAAATAIWAKPDGVMPRAIAHCRSTADVQSAVQTARDWDLPLSVRGGGHDWAGRSLCGGHVIDLSGMRRVDAYMENCTARIGGGARAADVIDAIQPHGLAAVTGSCAAVGMAGLTLGGGYGSLIGRFGLALDNLLAAEVVLADGRIITATRDREEDLFWALRGGGGNFGVVTDLHCQLHHLPSVRSGMLIFPLAQAKSVLEGYADFAAATPEELTAQIGLAITPDGSPVAMIVPTWSGPPEHGETQLAPLSRLGTPLTNTVDAMSYRDRLALLDPFIVNGQRVFMETCWLPALDGAAIDIVIEAMKNAASPGCAIFTHDFKGAAARVPVEATAFGLRREHVLIEILALWADGAAPNEQQRHQQWARATRRALDESALPGGYPNLLARNAADRAVESYGNNADRLLAIKRRYDPDNVFQSAIPLPVRARQTSSPHSVSENGLAADLRD
jgi:FAD/FMN-containing dehydrogenase